MRKKLLLNQWLYRIWQAKNKNITQQFFLLTYFQVKDDEDARRSLAVIKKENGNLVLTKMKDFDATNGGNWERIKAVGNAGTPTFWSEDGASYTNGKYSFQVEELFQISSTGGIPWSVLTIWE